MKTISLIWMKFQFTSFSIQCQRLKKCGPLFAHLAINNDQRKKSTAQFGWNIVLMNVYLHYAQNIIFYLTANRQKMRPISFVCDLCRSIFVHLLPALPIAAAHASGESAKKRRLLPHGNHEIIGACGFTAFISVTPCVWHLCQQINRFFMCIITCEHSIKLIKLWGQNAQSI